jgi:CRP-like cAMP-binding protein
VPSLAVTGGGFAVLAIVAVPACARVDVAGQESDGVRALLCGVPFLKPLPLPVLERLVRTARPVDVTAGDTIVRTGELGVEFFVIESGTADVVEYGRQLGPGDGFGEIALVRATPRTATVTATSDMRLLAVDGAALVAAVTGQPDAALVAGTIVDEHLARPRTATPD